MKNIWRISQVIAIALLVIVGILFFTRKETKAQYWSYDFYYSSGYYGGYNSYNSYYYPSYYSYSYAPSYYGYYYSPSQLNNNFGYYSSGGPVGFNGYVYRDNNNGYNHGHNWHR